jgi:hypothetical protein
MTIGVDKDEMLEYINKYNLNDSFIAHDITLIYLKPEDDDDGSAYEHYEVECRVRWVDPQTPKFTGALRKCLVNVQEYRNYIKRKHSIKWL